MKARFVLRLVSLVMLILAITYVSSNLASSALQGASFHTLLKVEINIARALMYVFAMSAIFLASFFVKDST